MVTLSVFPKSSQFRQQPQPMMSGGPWRYDPFPQPESHRDLPVADKAVNEPGRPGKTLFRVAGEEAGIDENRLLHRPAEFLHFESIGPGREPPVNQLDRLGPGVVGDPEQVPFVSLPA